MSSDQIAIAFGVAVASLVLWLVVSSFLEVRDRKRGTEFSKVGTVAEKHYEPEHNSSGTGIGLGSNGSTEMISTSSHSDEEFLVLVDVQGEDEYEKIDMVPRDYKKAKVGSRVRIHYIKGLSGKVYGPEWYELT